MWLIYAFGSAFFAGITSILAKCSIKKTDSNLVTAIRTFFILIFAWLMVFILGSQSTIKEINNKTLIFLVLSGLSTGISWLCYFKALQLGNVNKVTPIDKSSTVLTIILSFIILGESVSPTKIVGIIAITVGTYLMIQIKKLEINQTTTNKWLIYALLSAISASLTSIFGKIGIQNVESNLGTAIRTIVVFIMAWLIVFITKKQSEIKNIDRESWLFIFLSSLSTGASWLCYYKALQNGPASIVVPIDKLSIVITLAFSYFILKEKLSKKSFCGLIFIVAGTLLLLVK